MRARTDEFRMRGIIYIVLYHNTTHYCITYDVHISLRKIHEQPPTPLMKRTFKSSGYDQMGGPGDQHEHIFIYSKSLYMHYLDKFQYVPTITGNPDVYFVPSSTVSESGER